MTTEHNCGVRASRRWHADASAALAVQRRGSGDRLRARLSGRCPSVRRRSLRSGGRGRQQPGVGVAHQARRRFEACLGCPCWRAQAGQRRRERRRRIRRQRRPGGVQLHGVHFERRRPPAAARGLDGPAARCAQPGDVLFNSTGTNLIGARVGTSQIDSFSVDEDGRLTAAWARPSRLRPPARSGASSARPTRASCSSQTHTQGTGTARSRRSAWPGTARCPRSAHRRSPTTRPPRAGSKSRTTGSSCSPSTPPRQHLALLGRAQRHPDAARFHPGQQPGRSRRRRSPAQHRRSDPVRRREPHRRRGRVHGEWWPVDRARIRLAPGRCHASRRCDQVGPA